MKKRILYILLIILYTISISRISYLMIYKKGYYKEILKQKNNKIIYGNSAPRGRILDRSGNIIVDNVGIKTIIYNKIKNIELKDEIDIATKLSEIIGIDFGNNEELKYYYYITHKNTINKLVTDEEFTRHKERKINDQELLKIKLDKITEDMINSMSDIEKKASKIYSIMSKGYNYEDKYIKKNCTDEEYSKVIELNLPGIRCELSFKRINNYKDTLSNVIGTIGLIPKEEIEEYKKLGYTSNDIVGTSYLEKYYEEYLDNPNICRHMDLTPMMSQFQGELFYFVPMLCTEDIRQFDMAKKCKNVHFFKLAEKRHGYTIWGECMIKTLTMDEGKLIELCSIFEGKCIKPVFYALKSIGIRKTTILLLKKTIRKIISKK